MQLYYLIKLHIKEYDGQHLLQIFLNNYAGLLVFFTPGPVGLPKQEAKQEAEGLPEEEAEGVCQNKKQSGLPEEEAEGGWQENTTSTPMLPESEPPGEPHIHVAVLPGIVRALRTEQVGPEAETYIGIETVRHRVAVPHFRQGVIRTETG